LKIAFILSCTGGDTLSHVELVFITASKRKRKKLLNLPELWASTKVDLSCLLKTSR
jgi:hypothetical protein